MLAPIQTVRGAVLLRVTELMGLLVPRTRLGQQFAGQRRGQCFGPNSPVEHGYLTTRKSMVGGSRA